MALLCTGCGDAETGASPAEAVLINDLREGNPKARLAAARQLGAIRSSPAVPGLARSLYDLRSDVRLAAAEALGRIGDPRAVDPLCRALKSREWKMRRAAADALGKIGGPRVIEPLAQSLADPEGSVSMAAAVSLGRIGAPAVPAVRKLLAHTNSAARATAAYALGRTGDGSASEPLRGSLDDTAPAVRLAAADALGRLGDPESAPAIAQMLTDPDRAVAKGVHKPLTALGTNAVPALVTVAAGKHREARVAALSLLAQIGDARAVPAFLDAAGDPDKWVSDRAGRSLARLVEAGRGIAELVRALTHKSGDIRATAIACLKRRPLDVPPAALRRALKDDTAELRKTAAEILHLRGNREEIGTVAPLLEDRDPGVRMAAATALASTGDMRGNNVLLDTLRRTIPLLAGLDRKEHNADIDRAVATMNGLANTRDKRAVELLLPLVRHPNRGVSCPAIVALGRIGDKRAVDALLPLLQEKMQNHRVPDSPMTLACIALGRIGDPRAFDPLATLLGQATHRWWTPIRIPAVDAMLMIDKQRSVEHLVRALNKAEMCDAHAIDHTCKALANIGDPAAIAPMTRFLLSDITTTRAGTAIALKKIAETNPECMKELVQQLKQPNAKTRSILGLVIAKIGGPALPYLLEALNDKDPQLRHGAAWTLGSMKSDKAVDPLLGALADESEHVRAAAAWALGSIKTPRAVDPLIKLTDDEKPRVRMGAVTALGDIADKRAETALTRIAGEDREEAIRKAAAAALKKTSSARADPRDTTPDARPPATGPRRERVRPPAGPPAPGPAPRGISPSVDLATLSRELVGTNAAERAAAGKALAIVGKGAVPYIADALPQSSTIAARLDAVTVLAQISGPEILPALVKALENLPDGDAAKLDKLQTAVSDIMTGLGNLHMEALSVAAIQADCGIPAKTAAARACVRIGRPSVGHISGRILKCGPDPEELRLWLRTLGEIGHPGADLALEHAASQDIEGIKELVADVRRQIGKAANASAPSTINH